MERDAGRPRLAEWPSLSNQSDLAMKRDYNFKALSTRNFLVHSNCLCAFIFFFFLTKLNDLVQWSSQMQGLGVEVVISDHCSIAIELQQSCRVITTWPLRVTVITVLCSNTFHLFLYLWRGHKPNRSTCGTHTWRVLYEAPSLTYIYGPSSIHSQFSSL